MICYYIILITTYNFILFWTNRVYMDMDYACIWIWTMHVHVYGYGLYMYMDMDYTCIWIWTIHVHVYGYGLYMYMYNMTIINYLFLHLFFRFCMRFFFKTHPHTKFILRRLICTHMLQNISYIMHKRVSL